MKWSLLVLLAGCDQTWGLIGLGAASDGAIDAAGSGDAVVAGNWTKVSVGTFATCAVTTGGRIACWQTGTQDTPAYVDANTDWSDISVAENHACGIRSGSVVCWGKNDQGQVNGQRNTPPVQTTLLGIVLAESGAMQVGTGALHSCARTMTGSIYCWGNGQAIGGTAGGGPNQMVASDGTSSFTDLAVGFDHSCALAGARVYCWGGNTHGEAAQPISTIVANPTAIDLSSFGAVSALGLGYLASCAIGSGSGTKGLACWGLNSVFQATGDGHSDVGLTSISTVHDWNAIALGNHVACGIENGVANCWGDAHDGGLPGEPSITNIAPGSVTLATVPGAQVSLEVSGGGGTFAGTVGGEHACIANAGNIACWSPSSTPYMIVAPP